MAIREDEWGDLHECSPSADVAMGFQLGFLFVEHHVGGFGSRCRQLGRRLRVLILSPDSTIRHNGVLPSQRLSRE